MPGPFLFSSPFLLSLFSFELISSARLIAGEVDQTRCFSSFRFLFHLIPRPFYLTDEVLTSFFLLPLLCPDVR